jgi:asparagine synthase (glutamine-hydrolysing)
MGAFFIASNTVSSDARQRLDQAHREHGFGPARQIDVGAFSLYLYRKLDGGGGLFVDTGGSNFACLVGQLLYRGEGGEDGLRRYCLDITRGQVEQDRVIGQFALVQKDSHGMHLFTDPMGFYQIYLNEALEIASSSFWALLEMSSTLTVEPAGVYEYAWNGATFGGKTFVKEIRRLGAGTQIRFDRGISFMRATIPKVMRGSVPDSAIDTYVDEHAERLRRLFGDLAAAFGDRLRVSFSGGYDSRLILAGLTAAGLRPGLFVYGRDRDPDVRIAREVATHERLPLEVIDKARLSAGKDIASPPRQKTDFVLFDSWKVDGIFDDGSDAPDRQRRHVRGNIPLNGSLGEIYRNFFYIPDRAMTLRQVIDSFFSGYDPRACTLRFNAGEYAENLIRAFQVDLNSSDERLTRSQVESLYPLVRGRYWTGRDVNLNLRFGQMFFPFMQAQLIQDTAEIPIRFKNYGRLETQLIDRLDSSMAKYPSSYGYRFCDPPPLRYRAKTCFTLFRPPWLRRYSYRLRFASRRKRPMFLAPDRLGTLMDSSMPYMHRYFRIDRLHDADALNRVATMEYIFQRYGVLEQK